MNKKVISAMLAASMAVSLAACGSTATSEATSAVSSETSSTVASGESAASGSYTGTPIKVGGIGPITGAAATYGNAVKNAEELAVKERQRLQLPERLGHAGSGWPRYYHPDPGSCC